MLTHPLNSLVILSIIHGSGPTEEQSYIYQKT